MRHNNVIANAHFHKKWAATSRGPLKVKSWFDQPTQKKARRLKRAAKAAAIAPRPAAGLLRPAVHCPTRKYSAKVKLGRGFSLAELKAAKISPMLAPTIGIAVDHRRTNKSQESLDANVERLLAYKAKLVVFPRKGTKAKKGDADAAATAKATQLMGPVLPLPTKKTAEVEFAEITDEMKEAAAYSTQRNIRNEKKMAGLRKKALETAKEEDDKKA